MRSDSATFYPDSDITDTITVQSDVQILSSLLSYIYYLAWLVQALAPRSSHTGRGGAEAGGGGVSFGEHAGAEAPEARAWGGAEARGRRLAVEQPSRLEEGKYDDDRHSLNRVMFVCMGGCMERITYI